MPVFVLVDADGQNELVFSRLTTYGRFYIVTACDICTRVLNCDSHTLNISLSVNLLLGISGEVKTMDPGDLCLRPIRVIADIKTIIQPKLLQYYPVKAVYGVYRCQLGLRTVDYVLYIDGVHWLNGAVCSSVADWFVIPDTQSLLDFVRPDFLLLRVCPRVVMRIFSDHGIYVCVCVCWYLTN